LDGCPIEGIKVRYIGIDTPERGQCYWVEAKARTRELVEGKNWRVIRAFWPPGSRKTLGA